MPCEVPNIFASQPNSMKFIASLFVLFLASCGTTGNSEQQHQLLASAEPIQVPVQDGMERAYFASGCFWCVEKIYESVEGVSEAISGYSGGHTENPTYEDSNTGRTGHAEANEIVYDPSKVSFADLVDVYFASQNIEQVNGQGPDNGNQYRSIIFYQNADQKAIIDRKITALTEEGYDVAAEVMPFQKFWRGEEYHQDYGKKHPNQRYILGVSNPRFKKFAAKRPDLLKPQYRNKM